MPLMWLIVLGTSIWMAVDSSQLGYQQRDVKGLASMGPAGWLISGLLLWIVAFPLYLLKRPELKAAGQARRLREKQGFAALPPSPYGPYGPTVPGASSYAVPPNLQRYPQPGAGAAPSGYAQASGNPYGASAPGSAYAQGPAQPGVHSPNPGGYASQPSSAYWQNQGPAAASTEGGDSVFHVADEIVKLGALRDRGLLTDAEFQQRKTQLLNS